MNIFLLYYISVNCFFLSVVSEYSTYTHPAHVTSDCSMLAPKEQIPDFNVKKNILSVVKLPSQPFSGGAYTLSIKPKKQIHSCWYHYDARDKKLILLPTSSFSEHSEHTFEVTAQNDCFDVQSKFQVKILPSPQVADSCLKFEMLVQSGTLNANCDVTHIYEVVKKIAKYFNVPLHQIMATEFEKVLNKNTLYKITWSFTNQFPECQPCDKKAREKVIYKLVYPHGEPNVNFANFMNGLDPKFQIHYIHVNDRCRDVIQPSTTVSTRTSTSSTPSSSNCSPLQMISTLKDLSIPALTKTIFQIPSKIFNTDDVTISLIPTPNKEICWFRLRHNQIHFLPTTTVFQNQPSNGYTLNFLAKDKCGQSLPFKFKTKILESDWSKCLIMHVYVTAVRTPCQAELVEDFLDRLTNYANQKFTYRILKWSSFDQNTLKMEIGLSRETLDCRECSKQFLDSFKDHFVKADGKVRIAFQTFMHSIAVVRNVDFISTEACSKCANSATLPEIILTPGIQNKYEVDASVVNILPKTNIPFHSCWFHVTKTRVIEFLPTYRLASRAKNLQFEINTKTSTGNCPLSQTILVNFKDAPKTLCFRIKMTFSTKEKFSCLAEPVHEMVSIIATRLMLKTDDIHVIFFNKSTCRQISPPSAAVDLIFTLSPQVLPHSLCSRAAIQKYMELLINVDGEIAAGFVSAINGKFSLHTVSDFMYKYDKMTSHYDDYSSDHVSLWLYFLPLFILLFILLLLLLICCCSPAFYKCFVSCCCACCYHAHIVPSNRSRNRYHEKVSCKNDVSYSSDESKHITTSISKDAKVVSFNNPSFEVDTIVTKNASPQNRTNTANIATLETLKSGDDSNMITDGCNRNSIRMRSYSDGDLLQETLHLPQIPSSTVVSQPTHSTWTDNRAVCTRYRSLSSSEGESSFKDAFKSRDALRIILKSTPSVRVPVKLTARVKNLSTTPVGKINLRSFRPHHMEIRRGNESIRLGNDMAVGRDGNISLDNEIPLFKIMEIKNTPQIKGTYDEGLLPFWRKNKSFDSSFKSFDNSFKLSHDRKRPARKPSLSQRSTRFVRFTNYQSDSEI